MVQIRFVAKVAVRTFVNARMAITSTVVHVRHVQYVLEIQSKRPRALKLPIDNVALAPSHRIPRLLVIVGVLGNVTRGTINIPRTAISVPQRVRGIHTNQNLAPLSKTAYAHNVRSHTDHRGTASMAVVGHAIQVIIDLALLVMRVDRHVQAMRMKRLAVQQHKTAYAHNVRNLPIPPSPRLQDAAGVVILAITKVVIIALLAPHVQQESMNQEVVHPHKIVNVVYHACPNLATVKIAGKLMVMVVNCGDAKWAIIRMETRARNVHQRAKIMVQQEK